MVTQNFDTFSDKQIIERLINNDNEVIDYFFYNKCNPLLLKSSSVLLNGIYDVDDLRQELLCILSANEWKALKEFKFNSTLLGWIKVICANLCIKLRHTEDKAHFLPSYTKVSKILMNLESDVLESSIRSVSDPLLKVLLIEKYISNETDEAIMSYLNIPREQYKNKLHKAERRLLEIIQGDSLSTNIIEFNKTEKLLNCSDSYNIESQIIDKLDVIYLLNELSNDRYRYVIDSIMIQGKSIEDVADELNMRKSNISNIKHRALVQLAEIAKKNIRQ